MITGFTISWVDMDLLTMISTLKSVRLTGSFARLTPRNDSDLDFHLNDKDLQKLKAYLKEKSIEFDSAILGHITVDGFEFYCGFDRQSRQIRAEHVTINGIEFKTW